MPKIWVSVSVINISSFQNDLNLYVAAMQLFKSATFIFNNM